MSGTYTLKYWVQLDDSMHVHNVKDINKGDSDFRDDNGHIENEYHRYDDANDHVYDADDNIYDDDEPTEDDTDEPSEPPFKDPPPKPKNGVDPLLDSCNVLRVSDAQYSSHSGHRSHIMAIYHESAVSRDQTASDRIQQEATLTDEEIREAMVAVEISSPILLGILREVTVTRLIVTPFFSLVASGWMN